MYLNEKCLRELVKKGKAKVLTYKFLPDLDKNQMSQTLILRTAKRIKAKNGLMLPNLYDFNLSIQVNHDSINVVCANKKGQTVQIAFYAKGKKDTRIDDAFEVLDWEMTDKKLFVEMLSNCVQKINFYLDGEIVEANPTIFQNAKTGKFHFQYVRGMDSKVNYDTLDDACEALKATFIIKNEV